MEMEITRRALRERERERRGVKEGSVYLDELASIA